jgi:hypothetical protein
MNTKLTKVAPLGLLFLLLPACTSAPATKVVKASGPPPEVVALNDTARFLAGMPGRPDGPYQTLETAPSWKSYASEIEHTWTQAQKDQFESVEAFQKRELAGLHTGSSYVFYPFSGPDVLYMEHFFPTGKTYVLAGLEPVGTIKAPSEYTQKNLDRELGGWKQALASIFNRSFFVTSEMDRQFHGQVADGLLPMILLLLVRSGDNIDGMRYGHFDDTGAFLADDPAAPGKHQGVQLTYHTAGDTSPRTLYYFRTDLAAGFETHPGFLHFLQHQGTADTLVKSASFLLHWKMCSALRSYILESSNLILEDDTGVPYHYFQDSAWQVRLFGDYSRPDRPFKGEYQKDLADAFQDKPNVHELGFSLGYGYGRRPSSMILAERVKKLGNGS